MGLQEEPVSRNLLTEKKNDQILSLGSFKSKGKDKNQENYNKRYTAQNPALSRLTSPKLYETQSQSY